MEESKRTAINFFQSLGFSVREIPETNEKRADLEINDGETQYVIEVKEKLVDDSKLEYSTVGEGTGTVRVLRDPHLRWNRIDGVLKDGEKQLSRTPAEAGALKLLWLASSGPHAETTIRRALYSFYGIATLTSQTGERASVNCVYFDHSTAFASPNVSGLILVENDELQLCLNEFAADVVALRKSRLASMLGSAIYDPDCFESREGTIVFRSDISRSNEQAVLDELERVSGIRYSRITLHKYTYSLG